MRIPDVPFLGKVALIGAVATVGMAVAAHTKHQEEMRSSIWLKHIREKLNNHPGAQLLIGQPPLKIGTLHRRKPTYELPSVDIEPPPPHLVTMSVKGDKGNGTLYAWLNNPTSKKIEHVNDWNVAHVELQMEDRVKWPHWSPFAKIYDPLQSGSIDGTDTTPHDRALIRAIEAKYIPPNKNVATPDAEKTLFVGRLDHKTTEENLRREFSKYGTITHCRIVKDVVTGFSRGYAFVQFKHLDDAEKARRDAHHAVLDGREILVEWENGRTMPGWIPRRLGGGFGGKKESGQLRFGGRDRPFRKPIVIKPLRSSNLEGEDAHRFQDSDRQIAEDEKSSSRTEYSKYPRDSSLPRKNFQKRWDQWNPGYSRGGRSWRDEEDRRYSGKSSNERDSYREDKSIKYSNKRDRDDYRERGDKRASGKEDRRHSMKSSRNQNEWEDRRPSRMSIRDRSERGESDDRERRRDPEKFSRDRNEWDESDDRERRRDPEKSSRDRNEWEHSDHRERRRDPKKSFGDREKDRSVNFEANLGREERFKMLPDLEDREGSGSEKEKSESVRRSQDQEDSSQMRVKIEQVSPEDRNDKGDWEETSEDERCFKRSPKDREDDRKDSPEGSKSKKRSKRSRVQSDSEDDGREKKPKKKRKRSKKSSRDHEDNDESDEEKKKKEKKKKKKHKRSREHS